MTVTLRGESPSAKLLEVGTCDVASHCEVTKPLGKIIKVEADLPSRAQNIPLFFPAEQIIGWKSESWKQHRTMKAEICQLSPPPPARPAQLHIAVLAACNNNFKSMPHCGFIKTPRDYISKYQRRSGLELDPSIHTVL